MYSKITVYLWEKGRKEKEGKNDTELYMIRFFFIVRMVCDENIVLDSNQRDVWKIYIFGCIYFPGILTFFSLVNLCGWIVAFS